MTKTKAKTKTSPLSLQVGDIVRIVKIYNDPNRPNDPYGLSIAHWNMLMKKVHEVEGINGFSGRSVKLSGWWIPIECCRRYRKAPKPMINQAG